MAEADRTGFVLNQSGFTLEVGGVNFPEVHQSFFPVSSSTAAVIAVTPTLIVGSGSGAQRGEWSDGSGLPVCPLSLRVSGLTPPTTNMKIGILCSVRPYSPKSSPPIEGFFLITLV